MSIKSKVLAAAAAVTVIGGISAAGALTASAATPSAGPSAVDVFSPLFGTHHNPAFVLDVLRQGEKVGQPIILFRTSNSDPAEDFTFAEQGFVSDFYTSGLVSSSIQSSMASWNPAWLRMFLAFHVSKSPKLPLSVLSGPTISQRPNSCHSTRPRSA